MGESDLYDDYDVESKKKALIIARDAFEACEKQGVSGVMAVGAFLDHILFHLVAMNDREVTASFLQALAAKVIDGVYDAAEEKVGKDTKKDTASNYTP
ncbi:MAG: hypothetical protein QF386_07440 [Alphaproteobacteria bacterium]|jgi:hypothetical protein|nr:hypothetical protein [Rhodospirillaceae bacterium]MDP6486439.1 hypothetical protein [Alphaproteobacteria bacterium]MDP6660780.1 hypothetical protein [Alphaproteobacteria bacterium]MDP6781321.1 hypothetical protein [Alphaproteobacteria bacterium]MDP7045439.1 hypothetical protein [Alphaproteobacteria bacterium]|tara:strand:+ start:614 stop:907 length:294 start_codon:yes stop_codon:yes gene_type:complete